MLKRICKASFFIAALSLEACSVLPGSGPSREIITQTGTWESEDTERPFAFIEVDAFTLNILARRPAPGLRGYFGDRRPPARQPIGVGDTLQITIWEAAAGGLFSTPVVDRLSPGSRSAAIPDQVVGRDGSVSVPYAGRIEVAGRTQQEVESTIVDRLRGKAIEPQVLVNVTRNVSNTVTVSGDGANGALVPLTQRGERIMDVIALAGGFHSPLPETFVSLTRDGRTARAPIQSLLDNPGENIFARPGDMVTVERAPLTFTVVGATGANAVIPFQQRRVTLEEAVARAGGLQDMRADPDGVFVLRYEPVAVAREYPSVSPRLLDGGSVPIAYHLNMRDPKALFLARRFAMRDKDILFVSNAPLTEISKFFQMFLMVAQPGMQAGVIAATVK
ncbi:polysaccharide biosynthesis/export family protein [Methylocystis bryophila]|nr:polysaccharide biosynthesis/export family protein [Methylocystis bryophila]BDV39124.1 capsular polysaccharide biosynthesis protein [Methylocystis bryophila]